MRRNSRPVALTIAGSDSGGGAGIQADLRTWNALGVHGTTAITCLTAQNPRGVLAVHAAPAALVERQLQAVFDELPPVAVKTGMLFNASIIRAVARWFSESRRPPLVVDPVMVATSGARLLQPAAMRALIDQLLPLATLVTPNLDETALLIGRRPRTLEDLREAARTLFFRHGCAALIKGGHLRSLPRATDVFFDGATELVLSAPFVRGVATHGTGCTYSAAITGYLALGLALPAAVELAKNHITQSIAQSVRIGRHLTLNPFWSEG
ncbi:MAG: bifunctional hydroxymethylpyrimidine kinase/phosphomethylpyrimidine kinase [Verrucomicrobiales bacterium]|nr:bifunctional hydroxymethylpyrimidine kinase/phosphomethylpyrimidine kinase [Verrucomicrobiales bacterium]